MFNRAGAAVSAFLLVVLVGPPAFGSAILLRTPEALAARADVVLAGRVVSQRSFLTSDGMRILTETQLEVDEVLKGPSRERLALVQPGGEVDGIGQRVSGLASFQTGEKVLLFLRQRRTGDFQVAGMAQGKFRLELNPRTRELEALPDPIPDATLVDPSSGRPVPQRLEPLKLSSLRTLLRAQRELAPGRRP